VKNYARAAMVGALVLLSAAWATPTRAPADSVDKPATATAAAPEPPPKSAGPAYVVPAQHIVGAENPIPLGELVDLTVSPVEKSPQYLQSTSYVWKVFEHGKEKRAREYDGGIFFGAGIKARKLLVECAVTYLYLVKDGDGKVTDVATRTVILSTVVQIGEPGPTPPEPGPNPPAPPLPPTPLPDGQFKLAQTAFDLANQKITDPAVRPKAAKVVAQAMRGIASAVAAGTITTPEDVLKQTKQTQQSQLKQAGVDLNAVDAFGAALQDAVYGLYQQKKLNTAADFGAAWNEIATGLEKVQ
jgi:hypothetical protein